jgi:ribosomal protein S18 acetylase RimI-like enzyme
MTGSDVTILPFAPAHLEGFRQCVGAVAREKRWIALVDTPPLKETKQYVDHMLAHDLPFFVVVDHGEVVGWCDLSQTNRPTQAHIAVLGIGLLPPYRDRGIGRKLMQTAIDAAKARGLERITLHVHANNERARKLYEKLGFKFEGVMRRAFKVDDYYDDVVVMGLVFEEERSVA